MALTVYIAYIRIYTHIAFKWQVDSYTIVY